MTPVLYGLDIETDTSVNGLDPSIAPLVAIALSGADVSTVIRGSEEQMLYELDGLLAQIPSGVIVTWNGSAFDLPFLQHRADLIGLSLGLRLSPRSTSPQLRFKASWYGHKHLDAYLAYSYELSSVLPVSCGLKAIAALDGLDAIQVDVERLHELPQELVDAYVMSDAFVAKELAARRWQWAQSFVDRPTVIGSGG